MIIEKSKQKIAIIDANNFYVSCERLFRPDLEMTPAAVLSNNDGCFIARSSEVKSMGIKMGQPVFKLEKEKRDEIKLFSSNYALYGDISDRIVNILKRLVPKVETYSIDESFLDLSHIPDDKLEEEIKGIKSTIQRLTGIPVSIGVGPNKTLAKLSNHISKTNSDFKGCCSYFHIDKDLLLDLDVEEVWGIGRNYKKRLEELGVTSIRKFKEMDPSIVKKLLHIVGLRTWYEINEYLCHPIETKFRVPKMITCSRSFGSTVWEPIQVRNAFWTFLQTCHKKLKKEKLGVNQVNLFATTNRFDDNYFTWSVPITLSEQTDDIDIIWNNIYDFIQEMPVRLYYRAGISFSKLNPKEVKQVKLLREDYPSVEKPEVTNQKWMTRREHLSKEYTTSWDDIPLVF